MLLQQSLQQVSPAYSLLAMDAQSKSVEAQIEAQKSVVDEMAEAAVKAGFDDDDDLYTKAPILSHKEIVQEVNAGEGPSRPANLRRRRRKRRRRRPPMPPPPPASAASAAAAPAPACLRGRGARERRAGGVHP